MTFVFDLDARLDLPTDEVMALLGGKAANLAVMAADLGLPVPPAFAISTAACNAILAGGWPATLDAEIREHLAIIEERVGRRFGDAADPLLVSVRSGAPVSMPGMMDTILDLGLNDATQAGLARASGSAAFAADCRRRFDAMFRDVVGAATVPDDPWAQLRAAIEAVFRSWNSDRAKAYRQREGIAETLGTGVVIQAMVFGNRGADSGSGVLFTRNPVTGEPGVYGDVMFDAQGEDVVAGTHRTHSLDELAKRLPSVGAELGRHAMVLERHHADLCDIEFTIEEGRLWMLQCRVGKRSPQAALRMAVDMANEPEFPLSREAAVRRVAGLLADPPLASVGPVDGAPVLTIGLPASPGLASGEIATTAEACIAIAEAGRAAILVRAETSPDDVHGMARAAGILTSIGGVASHAAVVARGWGIPAVVGASAVSVGDSGITIGDRSFPTGAEISIDGGTGRVYEGRVGGATSPTPEAAILLAWARGLGIEVDASAESDLTDGPAAPPEDAQIDATDILTALAIRGYATPAALADALFAPPETVARLVEALVAGGLVEPGAGAFRLTAAGKAAAADHLAADRDAWGVERATGMLDGFAALDRRMKETVTAWQLRDVAGESVPNDHQDAAYDAEVLDRLAALHADARAWLGPVADALDRYRTYRRRLDRAAERAASGDGRYLASPRVDSYHGVWFELHEDLIQLSGRTRAEEVAAGRA
ncbi:MAG: pyruvate, phosphate dikinase [Chloroflexota bacterium]|nr:MAG: pyruvate, phosphate dikinase [Chloroflexota bacterium]